MAPTRSTSLNSLAWVAHQELEAWTVSDLLDFLEYSARLNVLEIQWLA